MEDFLSADFDCPTFFSKEVYYEEKQKKTLPDTNSYIKVTLFEMELLTLLFVHKALSSKQLLKLYNAYYPINKITLRRKLARWSEKNVITKFRPSTTVHFDYHNVYSIGERGLKLLVENNYLDRDYLAKDVTDYAKITNFTHTIGQQDVAIELFSNLKEDGLFFETIRPSGYISKVDIEKYGEPDWVLRYTNKNTDEDTIIFIEFDVGTERTWKIYEKFHSYIQRAKKKQNEKILVLFAVMDESFHYRGDKTVSGKQRLGKLKHFFLKEGNKLPPNLKIKISYRNRVCDIVKRELIQSNKTSYIDDFKSYLENVMEYQIKDITNKEIYMKEISQEFYADQLLEIYNKEGIFHERIGVIVINEGDTNSFYKVIGFYQSIKDRLFKSHVSRLILIYENEESMNDPYSFEFDKSVLLTDRESTRSQRKMIFKQFINQNGTKNVSFTLDDY